MAEFAALQPWLNLVGLALDFLGVMLLAYEWRVAVRAERREVELAEQAARRELPPSMPRPTGPHQETFDYMNRRRAASMKAERARTTFSSRANWFVRAFALIAIGFMLQIIAAVPL